MQRTLWQYKCSITCSAPSGSTRPLQRLQLKLVAPFQWRTHGRQTPQRHHLHPSSTLSSCAILTAALRTHMQLSAPLSMHHTTLRTDCIAPNSSHSALSERYLELCVFTCKRPGRNWAYLQHRLTPSSLQLSHYW